MIYGIRRIVFEPAPRLRKPEKHLAAMADWAKSFDGVFPPDDEEVRRHGYMHWHPPVDRRLMDPPWAEPDHQRQTLQLMLDAAARLRAARPAAQADQRVYVIVPWPEPWGGEVGVFTDPGYGRTFEDRDHPSQTWAQLDPAERSLARELGLTVPDGFAEAGYTERSEFEEDDLEAYPDGIRVHEQEIWMVREPVMGSD